MKLLLALLLISSSAFAQDFYSHLNEERKKNGLEEIKRDKKLSRQAEKWLIKTQSLSMRHARNVNEILIEGTEDPLSDWLKSKGHRKILLGPYKKIGLAKVGNRFCARLE